MKEAKMEGGRIAGATFRQYVPWLVVVLMVSASVPLAGQNEFVRVRDMLQEIESERSEAAKSGQAAKFTAAYLARRLSAVGDVLNGELGSVLGGRIVPSCEGVQEDLRRSLGFRGEPNPNVASVLCAPHDRGAYYVVAYALTGAAIYSRSWVGVFGPSGIGHKNQLLASAENPLPDKTVALAHLPDAEGGGVRFLAYGVNWGDPHNRLTLIAYRLMGQNLKATWSRADLPEGQVKVEDGKIDLSFLSSAHGPGRESVHLIKESYRVTAAGIYPQ
jgi:hypothetical protein